MEDRIQKQIDIAAPVARVWEALTDSRQFGEWFKVMVEGEFVAGKANRFRFSHAKYERLKFEIFIQAIEPVSYFAYTWHPYAIDPDIDYSNEPQTLVQFHLTETAEGTRLVVTESGFEKIPPGRYTDAFRMNTRGWEQQMENIRDYLVKTS
ncbi:SRPBCC family protein [Granulicella sibirica]|uniref:Activator of Hsp90 ATPase homologue 1/2-like C-terminal domain-containing protein n=1 Tax=Granulicella sibirica TaxID=2479048 RepID=A0A4Q0T4J6_9BACT|nr:SRPBCC family protein [Granulicella sibirica]RXH58655.1 hypothetical protein GRAN_1965 [Granulicella sibirica]